MAFDMVGGARHLNATLAALCSLRRRCRLVLMGSMNASLPLSYTDLPNSTISRTRISQFIFKTFKRDQLAAENTI